ncbi:cyclic nucleotide-binding domain protein (macronuclear) [Tetrahymena thermophila SB210]|uniref:Cyclic nucleotide-binding domain protein n=1 Tax=Tetrahymena thermophila (strain SB210) TaxID=312017 RepID=I7MLI7_TETTS|nr:cyclic nucleotide-binding domain protein [Tetrahymena thermophila SB210]EAS02173.2 cyclic nucleotide-binding domain protein [Tetrahymena thermophila SB210]|eukprot:XP_001022418.2 cyclic nucleotide-binding domain protein [Tetrahymena thermophila SB210]
MSSHSTRKQANNSFMKDKKQVQYEPYNKKKSNNEIDQSAFFNNKNDDETTIDQNKSLYSLKNSQYSFEKTQYKKGSILVEEKQIDFFNANNVRNIIQKERKTPTDLINLGNALKNYWFFDDYKKTLPFSNYLSLLKSIEYQFVKKGEIVYSIGQKSTEMFVILEGSFFVLIRNPKSLIVYNTPKAAQQQLELNQQTQANNQNNQNQQQPPQQGQFVENGTKGTHQLENDGKNVNFSQAWEYIEQQTLQDEINKKMQAIKNKDGPLEWFEISDELSDTILVDSLKLGNNFGEFELMYNKLRSQIIIAREDSHLIKISQQQYELLPKEKNQKQYNSSLDFLYSFDFFHDWGRQMMNLLVCFEIVDCYLNQIIYKEQEESDYLYFVYQGEFEITKKIKADENHQKVLELANIPLFNYKKNIKSQIKNYADYSERVRICIYGPNTYFGDDELLHLEKRKTQATCISEVGVLYKLSLKKLVKIVCNQNNIWEMLQNNLRVKRKWQKQFFAQLNPENKQNQIPKMPEQKNIQSQIFEGQKLLYIPSEKFQARSYYKGFKDNYINNIQNAYSEAANNIINLHQRKSSSSQIECPSILLDKKDIHDSFTQYMKNISEGNKLNMNQLNYNDQYVTQNSPIQTTKYFNLKQELLNKQFFQERSKDLIQIQQNMVLLKRFKDHQKQLNKIDSNEQQQQEQLEEQILNLNQQSKQQNSKSKSSQNSKSKSPQSTNKVKEVGVRSNKTQQGQRNKQHNLSHKNSFSISDNKDMTSTDNQTKEKEIIVDRNSIIRKEDLPELNLESQDKNKKSSEKGIQIDLRIFHENTNEENFEKKKHFWYHITNSKEKITSQEFYDKLIDAVGGGVKRPQTKTDLRSKTQYKRKIFEAKNMNQSLNQSQVSYNLDESSIQQEKNNSNLGALSPFIPQAIEGNSFRKYYHQNKDKKQILDKLRFQRLMKPQIDEKINQEQQELQQGSTFFTTQIQLSPLKVNKRGSQTSRDNYRSKSSYNQSLNSSRRNSQILELQQELFGNILKTSVLKQQQFLCLGQTQKQNQNISQSINLDANTNNNNSSFGIQNQTILQSIIPFGEREESSISSENKRDSLLFSSPKKSIQYYDEKLHQQKLEVQINHKLNIPTHNKIFKEGDNIYIKTGGFPIKKPCPIRFIKQN